MTNFVLQAKGLSRRYPGDGASVRAVDAVDLAVDSGEPVSVMGPSGCGKSTLLHLLGGLERPTSGEVWLDGQRVDRLSETGGHGCAGAASASCSRPSISWTSFPRWRTWSCPRC